MFVKSSTGGVSNLNGVAQQWWLIIYAFVQSRNRFSSYYRHFGINYQGLVGRLMALKLHVPIPALWIYESPLCKQQLYTANKALFLFVWLFVCLFVCLLGCLFVCLFVCLFSNRSLRAKTHLGPGGTRLEQNAQARLKSLYKACWPIGQ